MRLNLFVSWIERQEKKNNENNTQNDTLCLCTRAYNEQTITVNV